VTALFTEGKGSLNQVVSCYLLQNIVLSLNIVQIVLGTILLQLDDFDSIDILCLFPSGHIDLPKGSLPQQFDELEA
jgi:hypothetical protein